MRRSVLLAAAGVIVASAALFWSLRGGDARDAVTPSAPAATTSTAAMRGAATTNSATVDAPRMPRWVAPTDEEATDALREDVETAKRESVQNARLPNGITATFHPKTTVARRGRAELILTLTDADGKPVQGRGGLELIVVEDDGVPFKSGFIETVPGRYTALLPNRNAKSARASASITITERPDLDDPGANVSLSTEVGYAGATLPVRAHAVIGSTGVAVALDVTSPREQPGAVRAELRDDRGNLLGEATARATMKTDGPTEFVLSFPITDAQTLDDLRNRRLFLVDTTLFAGNPLRWTDFRSEKLGVELSRM